MKLSMNLKMGPLKIDPIKMQKTQKQELLTPKEMTEECLEELSEQAKHIKAQENRLAERMHFDNDRCYFFSVVFRSSEEMETALKEKKIKLIAGEYVFYEDIKDRFKQY